MVRGSYRIERELMDVPHVSGRRVSVLQLYEQVEAGGTHPATVADQLDLDPSDVYAALSYYYEHREEMETIRTERAARRDEVESRIVDERPEGVSPPE